MSVPDIGGAKNVDVIEVFVKPGDTIAKDASLMTLEGDKATMEVPSTLSGVVKKVAVKVGDKVSEGSLIVEIEAEGEGTKTACGAKSATKSQEKPQEKPSAAKPAEPKKNRLQLKKLLRQPNYAEEEDRGGRRCSRRSWSASFSS